MKQILLTIAILLLTACKSTTAPNTPDLMPLEYKTAQENAIIDARMAELRKIVCEMQYDPDRGSSKTYVSLFHILGCPITEQFKEAVRKYDKWRM